MATADTGAPARRLAAAPTLLHVLERAKPILEAEMHRRSGIRMVAVLTARNAANDAIVHARLGVRGIGSTKRPWRINEALPAGESAANARLLDAAAELHDAVTEALAALAGEQDHAAIRAELHCALTSAEALN